VRFTSFTGTLGQLADFRDGLMPQSPALLVPAQAGIQAILAAVPEGHWIPALAGMTSMRAWELGKGSCPDVGSLAAR
jgi:hypothetical protein